MTWAVELIKQGGTDPMCLSLIEVACFFLAIGFIRLGFYVIRKEYDL